MKDITVMLTASGSQFAPGIIRCLKNNGERNIKVIGGDMCNDPTNKFLVDKFYNIPAVNDPKFVDVVIDVCKKESVDILLPQISAELPCYLKVLSLFKEIGTKVSMTCSETVNIANNKLKLYFYMKERGIPTPDFYKVASIDKFEKTLTMLGYPNKNVCIKMPELSGSRGIRIIDSKFSKYDLFVHQKPSSIIVTKQYMLETLSEAKEFPEILLMEYMPGDEYTIGLLAENGRVKYIAGRRSPVMLMSIAQESVVEKNDRAYQIATQVVDALRLDGNIGMDFMFDAYGKVQLMDINPRIDATVSLFAVAGLNLPYLRIKQLLGETLPEINIAYGTRLKRRYSEMFTNSNEELIKW